MKTAVLADYKTVNIYNTSNFLLDLTPDYSLVSNSIYIEMITKLLPVDTRGSLRVVFCCQALLQGLCV